MTKEEMSNEFDILYNQVNSNQAPGVDEYEKSIFLTKAQDDIIRMYFDPRGNKFQEGFDGSQKRQYDFSTILTHAKLDRITDTTYDSYDPRALSFKLPKDFFLSTNESVVEKMNAREAIVYQIIPISYYDYGRLMQKPYQYPPKRSVWRLITENISTANIGRTNVGPQDDEDQEAPRINRTVCEIIGRFINPDNIQYRMRYVKRPLPILLENFSSSGLSIDGHYGNPDSTGPNYDPDADNDTQGGISCKLPTGVHHEIVQRAVELCTAVYNPQALGNLVGVGNVSATNLGVVPSNNKERD